MLNTLKTINRELWALLLIVVGATEEASANCQKPESNFEQKDCDYQAYLNLQSQFDLERQKFSEKFIAQTKENGGDAKAAKAKLMQAYSAWKKYVQTDCELDATLYPGNNAGENQLACEADHIQRKIKAMKEYKF